MEDWKQRIEYACHLKQCISENKIWELLVKKTAANASSNDEKDMSSGRSWSMYKALNFKFLISNKKSFKFQ